MSARDWQPSEAEVEAAYKAWQKPCRVVDIPSPAEAFKEGYRAARADLLPVAQAVDPLDASGSVVPNGAYEAAIERAAEIAAHNWPLGSRGIVRALAEAGLLVSPARSDALDASATDRHAATPSASEPGRSEAEEVVHDTWERVVDGPRSRKRHVRIGPWVPDWDPDTEGGR